MNLFHLKPALLPLLFFWQTPPQPSAAFTHFRYQRAITLPSAPSSGSACAVLDAEVFAHAAPALKDLRLYSGPTELPYATTVSEPAQQDSDDARILNLRAGDHGEAGRIVFDLEMPRRPYTEVDLELAARDFIATATVSGGAAPGGRNATPLGTFTLFDLTSQHLAHSTSIPLSESTFPYLHIELRIVRAPGELPAGTAPLASDLVKGASISPSREAQSIYTTTQQTSHLLQRGQTSIATFKVDTHVPIERVTFTLPPDYKGSFSRAVKIEAKVEGADAGGTEDVSGTILRVHKSEAGRDLAAEILSIPVAIGSNMQQPATIEVSVDNNPDTPLPLSVALQMRQRRICFDAATATAALTLYYGDAALEAPAYTVASLNQVVANPRIAQLGPETPNPAFTAALSSRRSAQQRPILRWIALVACVCIFALLVIRATHKRRR